MPKALLPKALLPKALLPTPLLLKALLFRALLPKPLLLLPTVLLPISLLRTALLPLPTSLLPTALLPTAAAHHGAAHQSSRDAGHGAAVESKGDQRGILPPGGLEPRVSPHLGEAPRASGRSGLVCAGLIRRKHRFYSMLEPRGRRDSTRQRRQGGGWSRG